jgi:IS5 family transposase
MSLNVSGFDRKVEGGSISVHVDPKHPLIVLAQVLPWQTMQALIQSDLEKTAKGSWNIGRPLMVRIHLAAYILQVVHNTTDRCTEENLKANVVWMLFAGFHLVDRWKTLDHTKIQTFRSRLSLETQRALANLIAQHATKLGFADPSILDIDSTVQEANAAYPSDAGLLQKLAQKCKEIYDWCRSLDLIPEALKVDIGAIKSAAKGYFFQSKNTATEIRQAVFEKLHHLVKKETYPIIQWLEENSSQILSQATYHTAKKIEQVSNYGRRYLLDVAHFVRTGSMKLGKRLSFHLDAIKCITKNKLGKAYQFGRVFQLGRIKGNFAFVLECTDLFMSDKESISNFYEEHVRLFGESLQSLAADKGYYSQENTKYIEEKGVKDFHFGYEFTDQSEEDYHRLYNRRAGIEPIIGQIKHGGQLRKSRMKSDQATLAAGYASVCGFNLRQLMNRLVAKAA